MCMDRMLGFSTGNGKGQGQQKSSCSKKPAPTWKPVECGKVGPCCVLVKVSGSTSQSDNTEALRTTDYFVPTVQCPSLVAAFVGASVDQRIVDPRKSLVSREGAPILEHDLHRLSTAVVERRVRHISLWLGSRTLYVGAIGAGFGREEEPIPVVSRLATPLQVPFEDG